VNRHSNIGRFNTLTAAHPELDDFCDPGHLLGWLHGPDGLAEEKNVALAALLRTATSGGTDADLATELLILALWPGLSTVRRRMRVAGGMDLDVLDGELFGRLTVAILKADAEVIRRVAATLLRNVERDLRRSEWQPSRRAECDVPLEALAQTLRAPEPDRRDALRGHMVAALGDDGHLLFDVHVVGLSQKEAAGRHGLAHEAARKRCQRTWARLMKLSEPMSR